MCVFERRVNSASANLLGVFVGGEEGREGEEFLSAKRFLIQNSLCCNSFFLFSFPGNSRRVSKHPPYLSEIPHFLKMP